MLSKLHTNLIVEEFYTEKKAKRMTGGFSKHFNREINLNGFCRCQYKGCPVTSTTAREMFTHMANCGLVGDIGLFCKCCTFKTDSKSLIEEHIFEVHADELKKVVKNPFEGSESEASAGEESSESDGSSGVDEANDGEGVGETNHDDGDGDDRLGLIDDDEDEEDKGKRHKCKDTYKTSESCSGLLADYTNKLRLKTNKNCFSRFADEWTRAL